MWLVLACGLSASPAGAGTCGPWARLSGESALIARLRGPLEARGIAAARDDQTIPAHCPSVAVEVRAARAGYDITISDAEGRMDRKTVDGPETVAMAIESWARADLSGSLLPAGRAVPPGAIPAAEVTVRAQPEGARVAGALPPLYLRLAGESTLDGQRTLWMGGSTGFCARVGWACIGAQGRFSRAMRGLETGLPVLPARRLDVLLAMQVPLRMGAVWLMPEVALGAGRLDRTLTVDGPVPRVELNGGVGGESGRGGGGRQGDGGRRSDDDDDRGGDGRGRDAQALVTSAGPGQGLTYRQTIHGLRASTGMTVAIPVVGGMSLALTMSVGWPESARAGLGLSYGPAMTGAPGISSGRAP